MALAIDIFRRNFVLLVATHFVAMMLGLVSLGLLLGPMMAGVMLITLALVDGRQPPPQVGDLFNGFSFFLQPLLFFLVWFVILGISQTVVATVPVIGQLASVCLNLVACALLLFAMPLIVDRRMDFWRASVASFEKVGEAFWPFVALSALGSLVASAGALLFGVGVFLTMPIYTCVTAVAYRAVFVADPDGGQHSDRPPPIDV
jgi:uncharacterized membrane protein